MVHKPPRFLSRPDSPSGSEPNEGSDSHDATRGRTMPNPDPASALALLEEISEGVLIVDDAGTVTYANRRGASLLGRDRSQLIGQAINVLLPAGTGEIHREQRAGPLVPPASVVGAGSRLPVDGGVGVVGPIEVNLGPPGTDAGTQVLYLITDISPGPDADARFEESERRFESIFRHFPVPCETWQRNGDGFILIDYNEADRVYTKDAIRRFLGDRLHLVHPDDGEMAAHIERCYRERTRFTREILGYRLRSTGDVKDLVVTFVWVEPDLVLTIIDDVSDQRAALSELKKLSSAVEQTADAVFITDRNGAIEYVNPGFEQITGYRLAEVRGKTPRVLKSGTMPPEYYQRQWSTLLAGETFRAEVVNRRRDGTLFVAEQTITPMTDDDGEIKHFVSVLKDMTERRELANQRHLFERMVSPGVIEQLDPDSLRLGGTTATITTLFADIRDFTTFSENQTPEQLVSTLNRYLGAMAEAVLDQQGTIDKFLGDAIMAWFNAPIPQADHTLRAVKAALAIRAAMEALYQDLPKESHLAVGVGIHSGDAVLGMIGTDRRMEYTAISDSVNIAKRLQENAAPNQIIISRDTYEAVSDAVAVNALEPIRVKGKRDPLEVFEVIGLKQAPSLL